eukprot:30897-Pelagococcus_subviridis.AAC.23
MHPCPHHRPTARARARLVRAGLSLQKRRDDTYGYKYTTSSEIEGDQLAADAVYDTKKTGTVYVRVYDATGVDAAVELTSITDAMPGHSGWDVSGPKRPASSHQPLAMSPDDSTWCGTGVTGVGSCTQGHPGGLSVPGWTSADQSAHGWQGPGGYRDVVLDSTGTFSHVYSALNMWKPQAQITTPSDPYDYQFRVFRWDGTQGTLASNNALAYSHSYLQGGTEGWILDAMAVNEAEGTLVYKATPKDIATKSRVGILKVQGGSLVSIVTKQIVPSYLQTTCSSCVDRRDAFRFNAATYASVNDEGTIIFAGSSRLEPSDTAYFPSLFKIKASTTGFSGDGDEMYFDGGRVTRECEGVVSEDSRTQGRFTTFKSVISNGEFGYVGSAAAGCKLSECALRAGCIWMFSLDFTDSNQETLEKVVLSGGEPGGLGELDVHRMAVMSDGSLNGGFLYATTGTSGTRIVKIEIGGADTSAACLTGCFRRLASYATTEPVRALLYAPDLMAIFTASMTNSSTTYTRFSTAEVVSLTPEYGPTSGAETEVTIHGSGFPTAVIGGGGKSHAAACRFGVSSTSDYRFPFDGWVPAVAVSSTRIICTAPPSLRASLTEREGPSINGVAEIEISFDGYPSNNLTDSDGLFQSSLWSKDHVVFRYYAVPDTVSVLSDGKYPADVMVTGEAPDQTASILTFIGGSFIDSGMITCRFNLDTSSDQSASYISVTRFTCPVCQTHLILGKVRCYPHGLVSTDMYHPMPWLSDNNPRTAKLSFSLNGRDFHVSVRTLKIFGQPHHLKFLHQRAPSQLQYGSAENSVGRMTLDPLELVTADLSGHTVQNDFGLGGTRGFTASVALNTSASSVNSHPINLIEYTAIGSTVDGALTLAPQFSRAPFFGDYHVNFELQDCTLAGECVDMPGTSTLIVSVMPGVATQILSHPGHVSSSELTSLWIPDDASIKYASAFVKLDAYYVDVRDAGANFVGDLDSLSHFISVSSTTSQLKHNGGGLLEERLTGAELVGKRTSGSLSGTAEFHDLSLTSQKPSGDRIPGVASTLRFGTASRGNSGTDEIYILQFFAELPSLASGAIATSASKLKLVPGEASYLNISDYADVTIICNTPEVPISELITVNLFDGGNNKLTTVDTLHQTVTVRPHGLTALDFTGNVAVTDLTGQGEWHFPASSIYLVCEFAGSYGLQFVSHTVTPTVQVINMIKGTYGFQWHAVQIGRWANLSASNSVPIGSFKLEVLDGAGNLMGIDDRYIANMQFPVNRLVHCSSTTVNLTGVNEANTAGSGVAAFSGLNMVRPTAGSHVISCTEHAIIIHQIPLTISASEADFVFLEGGNFTVSVVPGDPDALQVLAASALPNPLVDYSISLGNVNSYSFRHYASADLIVPLDVFRIRPIDSGANLLSGVLPAFNVTTSDLISEPVKSGMTVISRVQEGEPQVSTHVVFPPKQLGATTMPTPSSYLTIFANVSRWTIVNHTHITEYNLTNEYAVNTVTHTRRFVLASLPSSAKSGLYPYVTRQNAILAYDDVLIHDNEPVNSVYGTITAVELTGDANEALLSALALKRPTKGTYYLSISTFPSDPLLSSVSLKLTVRPGRAHHIGVTAPCVDIHGLSTCDDSAIVDHAAEYPCACAVYNVSAIVGLSPVRTFILDGGENILDGIQNPFCEPDEATCPGQSVTLYHNTSQSGLCLVNDLHKIGTSSSENEVIECAAIQPSAFRGSTSNGTYVFSQLALIAPAQAGPSDPLLLSFRSPGLLGVSFGLEIRPGLAVKLGLVLPPDFPFFFPSSFETLISTPVDPIIAQILDAGDSPLGDHDTHTRKVRITCPSATLGPYPGGVGIGESDSVFTQRDIAYFGSVQLLSPAKATHVVYFSTPDIISASLPVVVLEGEPVRLKVIATSQVKYSAKPLVTIEPITLGVYDAGFNYVGSANYMTKVVHGNITGGPANTDGVPMYLQLTENGTNTEILQLGVGTVTFSNIAVEAPGVGTYNITFGGDNIIGDISSFTIEVGTPYKLGVPSVHTMVISHLVLLAQFFVP